MSPSIPPEQGDHVVRWFAIWTIAPGNGLCQPFKKRRSALAARTPGTNAPADVILKTTWAELDRLGVWQRTFR